MGSYPPSDVRRRQDGSRSPDAPATADAPAPGCADASAVSPAPSGAPIMQVEEDGPFWAAGFEPGCRIHAVDGEPLRDIIDWRWLTGSADEIKVSYTDTDGDTGSVVVERDAGESWGVEFDGLLFDGVKLCRNSCSFCFMRQLPRGMRPSLYARDDDFRLSFLTGTFVTLTNMTAHDEARIVEQRLSPLRLSLHAHDAAVRERLIGRNAAHGLEVFERLQAAGIRFETQIVLVPGENDGAVLDGTLAWAAHQPGILNVGVVPLGYTRHQQVFTRSYDDASVSRAVLVQVERAQDLRSGGAPWVFAADEFYLNAYGSDAIAHIPPAAHYGEFSLFEDGVGMVRSFADDWEAAHSSGLAARTADALASAGCMAHPVIGEALVPVYDALLPAGPLADRLRPVAVRNAFFGGNVTVTGLLTGEDILAALRPVARDGEDDGVEGSAPPRPVPLVCIPRVVFNDDGLTLDGYDAARLSATLGRPVHVVSCSPCAFLAEIAEIAASVGRSTA